MRRAAVLAVRRALATGEAAWQQGGDTLCGAPAARSRTHAASAAAARGLRSSAAPAASGGSGGFNADGTPFADAERAGTADLCDVHGAS